MSVELCTFIQEAAALHHRCTGGEKHVSPLLQVQVKLVFLASSAF